MSQKLVARFHNMDWFVMGRGRLSLQWRTVDTEVHKLREREEEQ